MSDSISLDGKEYISSKRASQLSDYAQDYIGQLARKGLIDARRVGGLWYVFLDSLNTYKSKAETYKPQPPVPTHGGIAVEPDSTVSFDGKQYISAARAAKDTGYHQDYIGQLARSGKILSRQIGNRWYVDREALESHKEEKDGLLGAVQAESTGVMSRPDKQSVEMVEDGPFFNYTNEDTKALVPYLGEGNEKEKVIEPPETVFNDEAQPIHIRKTISAVAPYQPRDTIRTSFPEPVMPSGIISSRFLAGMALTFVIVLSLGFVSLKSSSIYAVGPIKSIDELASGGTAGQILGSFSEWVEGFFVQNITYTRQN